MASLASSSARLAAKGNAGAGAFSGFDAIPDAASDRVTRFANYLERDFKDNEDMSNIKKMLQNKEKRLLVDIDNLRAYDSDLAKNLLKLPSEYFPAFDKALRDIVIASGDAARGRMLEEITYYVGLKGSFGDHHVSPRTINASNLGSVIALEGIVTRCSLVRPKLCKSVHYCDSTQIFHSREYRDFTTLGEIIPTVNTYPTEDENGNPLTTEFGYCTFRDHQMIAIQEMPERAPPGQLPRSLDVILEDDLVDSCKPGDRVQIVGVYRSVGSGAGATHNSTFRTLILSRALCQLEKEVSSPTLTETDVMLIRKLAQQRASYITDLLAQSLAPSIYGHFFVKKALLLLLLGGMERNLDNGTHIRGDINMLLLGDPSTAKSQFLRFALKIAPLAIATTGRGSSGVGLTAAVTHDKETGDRRLEAGAMVLADRGVVCIDEFDKMNDSDRVSIHEVMEQQTITIAKAGIHTSLNARCSVIAAANPTYGQYDESLEPHRNIRLPDSLLSRFDLLFVILDKTDEATDRMLSSHVLQMHRYVPPGSEPGRPYAEVDYSVPGMQANDAAGGEPSSSSGDAGGVSGSGQGGAGARAGNWRGSRASGHLSQQTQLSQANSAVFAKSGRRRRDDLLTLAFVKKYIHYARNRMRPVLSEEASRVIVEAYAGLRNEKAGEEGTRRTLPVTPRTLETLIRLATAHAKARLSQRVTEADAQAANELLRFALFKEFRRRKRRKRVVKKVDDVGAPAAVVAAGNDRKRVRRDAAENAEGQQEGEDGDALSGSGSEYEDGSEADSDSGEDDEGNEGAQSASADSSLARRRQPARDRVSGSAQGRPNQEQLQNERVVGGGVPTAEDFEEFTRRLHLIYQEFEEVTIDQIEKMVNTVQSQQSAGTADARVAVKKITFSHPAVISCLERMERDKNLYIDVDTSIVYRM